jgi:hypothetical protein
MARDDVLLNLSYEMDDIIADIVKRYGISPLSVTAVILARLVLANDNAGSGDDFRKLLVNVPDLRPKNPEVH